MQNRSRPTVNWTLHPKLLERLRKQSETERTPRGRPMPITALVELALAEHMAIPLADRNLPEQELELCPQCETGVIQNSMCRICNWHRYERRAQTTARASD